MHTFRFGLAVAIVLGMAVSAKVAPAQPSTRRGTPEMAAGQPDATAARRPALDPARIVASQIRLEKGGDMTGMLSEDFRTAYVAVPRDADNLGNTILGGGYDVPHRVVRVSDLAYDAADPGRASAKVTLHYTNPDAPRPSFDRSIVVVFAHETGRWTIDDVHLLDTQGHQPAREVGLKRAFGILAEERVPAVSGRPRPASSP